jgi:hypothetical protein
MRTCPVLVVVLAAACASTADKSSSPSDSSPVSWLFVQNAARADLSDGSLVLRGVSPVVVCFTDRPARRTGTVPSAEFVKGWNDGGVFAEDPPNATLAVFRDGAVREAVVVLRRPRLSGDALTYDVDVLEGVEAVNGPAALFIDSVGSGAPVIRHGMHDEPGVVIRRGMHPVR